MYLNHKKTTFSWNCAFIYYLYLDIKRADRRGNTLMLKLFCGVLFVVISSGVGSGSDVVSDFSASFRFFLSPDL